MCSPLPKGQGYGSLQMTSWVMNQTKRTESAIDVWIDQFLSKPMESVLKWKVVFPIQSWQINSYILVNYEMTIQFNSFSFLFILTSVVSLYSLYSEFSRKRVRGWNACRVSEVLWNPFCFVKVDQSLCRENIFALTLFSIRDFYFPIRSFAHRCPDHHMNINDGVINRMSQHCKCFIYDRVKSPYGLLDELSTWRGTKLTESATVVQGHAICTITRLLFQISISYFSTDITSNNH